MVKKIQNFINDNCLLPAKTKTLFVAVSGGVDSCVLLHVLLQLKDKLDVSLEILHFNHRTRAGESDRDQKFVENLSAQYNLPLHAGRADSEQLETSETALREARYSFFETILNKHPQSMIATGHNRDDQVETFLMRLAKGSGLKGLLAIPASRGRYIRPLLPVSRSEILAYAEENLLSYRQDESNRDLTILRNRIRHQILPQWRSAIDQDADTNITKVIVHLAGYQELYESRLTEAVISSVKSSPDKTTLQRRRYAAFPDLIRRGLIEYCISKHYHVNYKISDRSFQIWDKFVTGADSGRRYEFLRGRQALAERDSIVFAVPDKSGKKMIPMKIDADVHLDEKSKISWIKSDLREVVIGRKKSIEYVDADQCGEKLYVRYWQRGDRFQPLGMQHTRKLSDFFIDLKLSLEQKKNVPLVCSEELIVWVAGFRISEKVKITEKTQRVYRLEIIK